MAAAAAICLIRPRWTVSAPVSPARWSGVRTRTLSLCSTAPRCRRVSLNASFDRKWNSNSKQFQRTQNELTTRLEAAAVELGATKDEYARYKSRAVSVVAPH